MLGLSYTIFVIRTDINNEDCKGNENNSSI